MKLTLLTAAVLVSVASAATCDYAVVGPTLQSLGKPIASCLTATDNSYNLARASAPPTPEQAAAICSKCGEFVDAIAALPPWPDCTMNVGGSEQTLTSYFDKMVGSCSGSATAANTITTDAPADASATAGSTGSAPADGAATVGSQVAETDSDVTTAPGASSTPVPSPTSAGYSIEIGAFAASAVATTLAVVF